MFEKHMPFERVLRWGAASALLTVLAACGGGGAAPASLQPAPTDQAKQSVAGSISLLAGDVSQAGHADGLAGQARFAYLSGAPVKAPSGLVYVADTLNHVIRSIDLNTTAVRTVVGLPGQAGFDDGTLQVAKLNRPWAVTFDVSGRLWISDDNVDRFRRLNAIGEIETVYTANNTVGSATSFMPQSDGSLLFTDVRYDDIRQVTSTGVVSVYAGAGTGHLDGPKALARFYTPVGMVKDKAGNLFVADKNSHAIRKISTTGDVSTLAGTLNVKGYADGVGSQARFDEPLTMAIDENDNLYVTEYNNCTLRKITPSGVVTTVAGRAGICSLSLGALPGSLPRNVGLLSLGNKRFLLTTETAVLVLTLTSP